MSINEVISTSLYRMIYPLVKILYSKDIAFQELSVLVKHIYIDVVIEDLESAGQKPTTSRIAILTGFTRKDVAELRRQKSVDEMNCRRNRMERVIKGWVEDRDFQDSRGRPAILLESGESPNLNSLIARYSGDMPVKSMLSELRRAGFIEERGRQLWELVAWDRTWDKRFEQELEQLADDVNNLVISKATHFESTKTQLIR